MRFPPGGGGVWQKSAVGASPTLLPRSNEGPRLCSFLSRKCRTGPCAQTLETLR